jgi:PAS domain S-box-containing protein
MPETVRRRLWPSRVAAGSAVFIAALGLMVLVGWFSHNTSLIQLRPELPPMTRNAAVCFLLCGLALITIVLKGPKWLVLTCAGIVSAASVLTIGEYVFRVNAGIDELLGPSYLVLRVSSPGRMAPVVAISFALGSIALLMAPKRLAKHAGPLLGLTGSVIAAAGIATSLAVVLGSSEAPEWSDVTHVAIHTALGLWTFGFGLLALAWQLEADQAHTPRWLPISVTLGVATIALALWQALIADGYPPFAAIPAAILICGCLMAPILGLTIYQAQLAHTQTEKLQAGERNLSLTINTIPTFIQVSRPDGSILSVNQAVLDYYGVSLQEMQKEDFRARVYHPDDLERLRKARNEALKRPQQFDYEQRALGKDGKYRWFLVRYNPLLDDQGRIDRWYATAFDIEDRKRAEGALRSVERNLNQIINTIPTHIYVLNTEGAVQYVNQAVMDYTGLSMEDVQQEDYRDRVIHPEDLERVRSPRAAGLMRGAPFSTEQRVLGHDGQYRWFLVRYQPLLDEQGLIVRWYVAAFDIEDRKRAEALLAGEKRLLEMVAGGNTLTSILDALCRLVEETASGCICGILLLDKSGTSVELARGPSLPPSYNEAILNWPVNPDSGPCARASFLKERVIVTDVASDLQWDTYGWRPLALSYGLRACWSTPILSSENAVLGTFALYAREPGRPNSQLQDVIDQMTHLAAVAIERQRVVEALQAEQELLDLAQKSARAMAFDWYIQQEVNVWSPEQEALYGLPPGSFDGTYESWKNLIYRPDWHSVVEAIKHAHETGHVAAEFRVMWPDGSLHWLSTNGRMFFDDAGEPLRMVGFTADVTRRKLVEEDLRRSEAFLGQAQQLSRTGSFSWRVHTDEINWSAELYRIYEFDPGMHITSELIRKRVHPEDLSLYEKMVEQARNGADDFEWQYRLLMPDHSIKYMHAVAQATRDGGGDLEYIAAVRDVTARRLADEALDKARSELAHVARVMTLGTLTASIAHEVNQPLSGIITNASTCVRMLDGDPPNVDGARETAKRTIRDGRRAADVITRLRALFTQKEASIELVDLNEATAEVIALSRTELERNRVIVRATLADNLPVVKGDRVQLQQVILNLLRNGSDAMSSLYNRPRMLLIKTGKSADHKVQLSVKDIGRGFEPGSLNRLFEAFYSTKSDGMGIGLSLSRSIIENHRGRLWATPNDGPGVTFSFSLPCADRAGDSQSKNDENSTEQ